MIVQRLENRQPSALPESSRASLNITPSTKIFFASRRTTSIAVMASAWRPASGINGPAACSTRRFFSSHLVPGTSCENALQKSSQILSEDVWAVEGERTTSSLLNHARNALKNLRIRPSKPLPFRLVRSFARIDRSRGLLSCRAASRADLEMAVRSRCGHSCQKLGSDLENTPRLSLRTPRCHI